MDVVVPEAIHQSREALRKALGQQLLDKWRVQYAANTANRFELSPAAKGARRLRTVALGYTAARGADAAAELALLQVDQADTMTDRTSDRRRVGKRCVRTCRSPWRSYYYKIKHS